MEMKFSKHENKPETCFSPLDLSKIQRLSQETIF